ncbi:MAG: outer membrane protein assembly factor BamD [Candidatus Theseobacter exili]|nr:outer membrane protein assembly factor BamD [Candidatus Theseobacter exili]
MKLKNMVVILSCTSCILLWSVSAMAEFIYDAKTGKWSNPKYEVKETPKEQYEHAVSFQKKGDFSRAAKEYSKLVKKFPRSKLAPQALIEAAENYEKSGYFYKAFQAYQKVIEQYPEFKNINSIVEQQYKLGNLFLAGEKRKFMKLPILPSRDKAIEIFGKVIENDPFGSKAAEAQLKIGITYEKQKKYKKAIEAYETLSRDYTDSGLADDAIFKAGWCAYKLSKGTDYDQAATDDALKYLQLYMEKYPDGESVAESNRIIEELNSRMAQRILLTGDFYRKKKNYEAAVIYYKKLIKKYPGTNEGKAAVIRINQLEKKTGMSSDEITKGIHNIEN